MSGAGPKLAFLLSTGVAAGCIGFVHYSQQADRTQMHKAVLADIAKEKADKKAAALQAECKTGLCDLKQTRQTA